MTLIRHTDTDTREKLCYVLLKYEQQTDRHYFHLYSFIKRLCSLYDLRLIIEQCEGEPDFPDATDIIIFDGSEPKRRWLFRTLRQAYRDGYRLYYCHYTFGAAIFASLLTRLRGGGTWFWHCIMMDVLLLEHNVSLYSPGMLIFRAGSRIIDHFVTGSEFMRSYYNRRFSISAKRTAIIPNYVSTDRFTPSANDRSACRDELDLPHDSPVVLFVHGLEKGKGGRCIVPIAQKVLAHVPETIFHVVGDGSERCAIEADITATGLGASIRMVGRVPNERIPRYFRAADIFIMPSLYEEFSRTLLEAMASGIPFVASDGRGGTYSYTSEMQHTMIVPAGDNDAFAEKLVHLLSNAELRQKLAEEGLRHVQGYSEEAVLRIFRQTVTAEQG